MNKQMIPCLYLQYEKAVTDLAKGIHKSDYEK